MEGTGVEVQRQGDDIKLIMPGNITFATDSANIAPSFYAPLNNLANSFNSTTRTPSRSSATPTAPAAASTTWTCPSVVRRAWPAT